MGSIDKLPPLPGSDEESMRRNSYDSFYKKRPGDIWQGRLDHTELGEPTKCEHFFEETAEGVQCKKCFMGLVGKTLKIKDGHVYFQDQRLL
jgi:hypothetical protein